MESAFIQSGRWHSARPCSRPNGKQFPAEINYLYEGQENGPPSLCVRRLGTPSEVHCTQESRTRMEAAGPPETLLRAAECFTASVGSNVGDRAPNLRGLHVSFVTVAVSRPRCRTAVLQPHSSAQLVNEWLSECKHRPSVMPSTCSPREQRGKSRERSVSLAFLGSPLVSVHGPSRHRAIGLIFRRPLCSHGKAAARS